MENIILFCLIVGVGSTIALDVWGVLVKTITKIPPTDWGIVGRWLIVITSVNFVLDQSKKNAPSLIEKATGWVFHYLVGIAYAALILLIYGVGFIENPTVMPTVIVGVILSTLAGLGILMPGLGGGFFARLIPNKFQTYAYIIVAHIIFAIAQFGFAVWFSR